MGRSVGRSVGRSCTQLWTLSSLRSRVVGVPGPLSHSLRFFHRCEPILLLLSRWQVPPRTCARLASCHSFRRRPHPSSGFSRDHTQGRTRSAAHFRTVWCPALLFSALLCSALPCHSPAYSGTLRRFRSSTWRHAIWANFTLNVKLDLHTFHPRDLI